MRFFCHYSLAGYCNTFLLGPDGGGDAVLIDPGFLDTALLELIEKNSLYPRFILVSHAHDAHIHDIKSILKIYDATLFAFSHSIQGFPATAVRQGQELDLGSLGIEVLETPGHSGDSVVYRWHRMLFTGDTLTAGAIGRTNDAFSRELLLSSIREKILGLDEEHYIFPGHGPPTTLDIERRTNPDLVIET
jgi:glyoxylase-like metal-dependent hydrolase (beta-lactamase superfamily II)